jgi:hypothetical protein
MTSLRLGMLSTAFACATALMWRHHLRTALARSLVRDGAIGDLLLVRAALPPVVVRPALRSSGPGA